MKKAKVELKFGQIWQVKKTLNVRTIRKASSSCFIWYSTIGGDHFGIWQKSFVRWVRTKKAVLIGHYDFKKGKAVAV